MKIPSKQELQQIALHHLLGIEVKDFINLYKKCTAKPYFLLVFGATLASDNPLRVTSNVLERI